MGLTAGVGIAAEDAFPADTKGINGFKTGRDSKGVKIAEALRKLAAEIESRGIDIVSLNVSTAVTADEIVQQRLSLNFTINEAKS